MPRRTTPRRRLLTALAVAGSFARPAAEPQHLDLADHPAFASVGMVTGTRPNGTRYLGSGTLINPYTLVTAAHVVDRAGQLTFDLGSRSYTAQRWVTHPKWHGGNFNTGHDLALVRLTEPVSDVAPAAVRYRPNERGRIVTLVGFGRGGTGSNPGTSPAGTKRAGQNRIDTYLGRRNQLMQSTFDRPGHGALPLEYQPAPGDSGGGVFIGTRLAGVVSYLTASDGVTDADFGDSGNYIRLSQHRDLLRFGTRQLQQPGKRFRNAPFGILPLGQPGRPIFDDDLVFPPTPLSHPLTTPVPEPATSVMLVTLTGVALRRGRARGRRE